MCVSLTELSTTTTANRSRLAEVTRAESTPQSRLAAWLAGLSDNTRRAYTTDLEKLAAFKGASGAGEAIEVLCEIPRRNALETLERWRDEMVAAVFRRHRSIAPSPQSIRRSAIWPRQTLAPAAWMFRRCGPNAATIIAAPTITRCWACFRSSAGQPIL